MKQKTGSPTPMGALKNGDVINFAVAAPGKKKCKLLLYEPGSIKPVKKYDLRRSPTAGDVFFLSLEEKNIMEYEYNYEADGELMVDPFAKRICGKEVWNTKNDILKHEIRGKVVDHNYNWEGDQPLNYAYSEVIAYSLHVRGFTKNRNSRVKNKGTFLGLIEKIPYLVELGINQIQCMPVYEFEECGQYTNYWGYGPAYWFAPKAAYAAGSDPVKELKDLVKACHQAGIEVVLDLPFTEQISKPAIEECLKYYHREYHIDGFILNPYVVRMDVIKSEPLLANVKIMEKCDDFQNVMRRFLKGDEGMVSEVIFHLRHLSAAEGKFNYITNHTGFTLADLVSYDGKHNEANGELNRDGPEYNYSWNCGAEGPSRKKPVIELRKKQIRNAFLLLLSAQGTPCILAGDEFGNTQKGNNNVYCQDNETGWTDWSRFPKEQELFQFVRELIAFRKEHIVFHPQAEMSGYERSARGIPEISYHGESAWHVPEEIASRKVGVYYSQHTCFAAYNMHWLSHEFALPALEGKKKWYQIVSTGKGIFAKPELLKNQKTVLLPERSAAVFIGK